jgi:hypothetical protein
VYRSLSSVIGLIDQTFVIGEKMKCSDQEEHGDQVWISRVGGIVSKKEEEEEGEVEVEVEEEEEEAYLGSLR